MAGACSVTWHGSARSKGCRSSSSTRRWYTLSSSVPKRTTTTIAGLSKTEKRLSIGKRKHTGGNCSNNMKRGKCGKKREFSLVGNLSKQLRDVMCCILETSNLILDTANL